MIKFYLYALFLVFAVQAEEYNQKDVDSLKLLMEMSKNPSFFTKEISRLHESIRGTSLEVIAEGVTAFKMYQNQKGVDNFKKIKESNPYFELMVDSFRERLIESGSNKKEHIEILVKMIFETRLREKQKISTGSVRGLEYFYQELIKDDPKKKAEFEKWLNKKWQEFYDTKPGNWYEAIGQGYQVNVEKLQKVNDAIEGVLLGFDPPDTNFNEDWKKLHSLKADFVERVLCLNWSILQEPGVYFEIIEELRLHILAGKLDVVEKVFPILRRQIDLFVNSVEGGLKAQSELRSRLFGKFYYLRGLHKFLIAKEKQLKALDAEEDLIGRQGALFYLYMSGLKGKPPWNGKAKKLYELIQSNTEDWFNKKVKDFPEINK